MKIVKITALIVILVAASATAQTTPPAAWQLALKVSASKGILWG
jgi:hypothetical protein